MEEITVKNTRFKYSGQYGLTSYYNLLYDLFQSMGYSVDEKKFRRKLGPDGNPVETEISWSCYKNVDNYSLVKISPKTLIVGMSKKQTQIDGKPVTRDVATLELQIGSSVVIDKNNKWESNPLIKSFRNLYDRYFYKETLNNIIRIAWEDHTKIENEMKAFFNMQNFL